MLVPTDERLSAPTSTRSRGAITPRTRAVVTVSPNNPTGAVYPEAALRAVNALCRDARHLPHPRRGVRVLHLRRRAALLARLASPAASGAHDLALLAVQGLRLRQLADRLHGHPGAPASTPSSKIQDTILICPPVVSQHAAIGALEAGRAYCDARIAEIAAVRDLVLNELEALADIATFPAPTARSTFSSTSTPSSAP